MRLVWTDRAAANLEEIADYIARDNPSAATRVTRLIVSSATRLKRHPHLGKPGRIAGTRELVIARSAYVAAYRVTERQIEILAVRHGSRDWPKQL